MFILKRWEQDCEGDNYNIETALCVSENKDLLINYHKKNEGDYLLNEGSYFYEWCKANNKDYYKETSYCTIGEIELLQETN